MCEGVTNNVEVGEGRSSTGYRWLRVTMIYQPALWLRRISTSMASEMPAGKKEILPSGRSPRNVSSSTASGLSLRTLQIASATLSLVVDMLAPVEAGYGPGKKKWRHRMRHKNRVGYETGMAACANVTVAAVHHAMHPLHRPGCAMLRCELLPANQLCVALALPELGFNISIPRAAAPGPYILLLLQGLLPLRAATCIPG
jgi:hypothetical protein